MEDRASRSPSRSPNPQRSTSTGARLHFNYTGNEVKIRSRRDSAPKLPSSSSIAPSSSSNRHLDVPRSSRHLTQPVQFADLPRPSLYDAPPPAVSIPKSSSKSPSRRQTQPVSFGNVQAATRGSLYQFKSRREPDFLATTSERTEDQKQAHNLNLHPNLTPSSPPSRAPHLYRSSTFDDRRYEPVGIQGSMLSPPVPSHGSRLSYGTDRSGEPSQGFVAPGSSQYQKYIPSGATYESQNLNMPSQGFSGVPATFSPRQETPLAANSSLRSQNSTYASSHRPNGPSEDLYGRQRPVEPTVLSPNSSLQPQSSGYGSSGVPYGSQAPIAPSRTSSTQYSGVLSPVGSTRLSQRIIEASEPYRIMESSKINTAVPERPVEVSRAPEPSGYDSRRSYGSGPVLNRPPTSTPNSNSHTNNAGQSSSTLPSFASYSSYDRPPPVTTTVPKIPSAKDLSPPVPSILRAIDPLNQLSKIPEPSRMPNSHQIHRQTSEDQVPVPAPPTRKSQRFSTVNIASPSLEEARMRILIQENQKRLEKAEEERRAAQRAREEAWRKEEARRAEEERRRAEAKAAEAARIAAEEARKAAEAARLAAMEDEDEEVTRFIKRLHEQIKDSRESKNGMGALGGRRQCIQNPATNAENLTNALRSSLIAVF